MEKITISISKKEYIAIKAPSGFIFVNLTNIDGVIPLSGCVAYVENDKVQGLPREELFVVYILEEEVLWKARQENPFRSDLITYDDL